METSVRRRLIKIVTFLGGLYFFLEFVLPESALEALNLADANDEVTDGLKILGVMAIGLGIINLFLVHGSKVLFLRKDWINSLVLLLGLIGVMSITTLDWFGSLENEKQSSQTRLLAKFSTVIKSDYESKKTEVLNYDNRVPYLVEGVEKVLVDLRGLSKISSDDPKIEKDLSRYRKELVVELDRLDKQLPVLRLSRENNLDLSIHDTISQTLKKAAEAQGQLLLALQKGQFVNKAWNFIYYGLFVALGSAVFSLLGVYVASAAYRAFRIRSLESSFMMLAALIVMLGQISFGILLSDYIPEMRLWLLQIPNAAAFRAITIGSMVAALVMAFRMWFSIESDFSEEGSQDEQ